MKDENSVPCSSRIEPVFTLFPRLPFELRAKIWDSCIGPQVLDVWSHYYHKSTIITVEDDPAKTIPKASNLARYPISDREDNPAGENGLFVITPERIPIMHICQESRAVTQSKGMFIFNSNKPDIELIAPDITWPYMGQGYQDMRPSKWELFDPADDAYFIHCSENVEKLRPVHGNIWNIIRLLGWVKNTIKHLALTLADFSYLVCQSTGRRMGQEAPGDWAWLAEFPNLKGISIIGGKQAGVRTKKNLQKRIAQMQESWDDSEKGLRKDQYQEKWKMPGLRYFDDRTMLDKNLKGSLSREDLQRLYSRLYELISTG